MMLSIIKKWVASSHAERASRNDEQLSLPGAKQSPPRAKRGGGNLFLRNGLLRCTLSVLLAMTVVFTQCQAAVEFDGVDDYFIAGRSINLNSNKWTLSLFANFSDVNGSYDRVLSYYGDGPTIWKNSGSPGLYIVHSGSIDFNLNISPTNNTWNHISVTRNGSTIRAFQNGFETSVSNSFSVNFTADTEVRIGNSTAYNEPFSGKLDDVRIYERPLTNGEILALYNSRSKRPSGSLANGLVAHYQMDDDAIGEVAAQAKDDSGNNNHGRFVAFDNLVSNGFSTDVPTQIGAGYSLEFDGVDDYVQINNHLLSNLNKVSICFMAKPSATNNRIEINEGTDGTIRAAYGLSEDGNTYILPASTSGYGYTNWSSLGVSNYIHYCGIYDGTQSSNSTKAKIYLNGLQKTLFFTGTIPNSVGSFTGNTQIGKRPTGFYSTGKIDEIRIYNRALIASEISFLYNGSGLDPGTSNLQALWAFDDDSALKDSSGNNNHGVGVGGDSLKYTEGILRR